MSRHPNATVALVAGSGLGSITAWVLALAGAPVPPEVAAAIAGGIAAFGLMVGRDGLRGVARAVWYGKSAPPPAA